MKNKTIKKLLINDTFSVSNDFHKQTKIKQFNKEKNHKKPKTWTKIYYKSYPRLDKIFLPQPEENNNNNLFRLLTLRRSRRKFSEKTLNQKELSTILSYSAGITQIDNSKFEYALRSYPSAGARFPLELYININKTDKIKKGIYHYNIKENSLELIRQGNYQKLFKNITNQNICSKSNINIIITAVFDRTRIKYGNRGYRFPFIEAGHLAQNLYLISESLKLNCCAIGGFIDNKINNLLDLADTCEKTIYIVSIGHQNED
jgi:SagB-type dehydrogenase family enzyme